MAFHSSFNFLLFFCLLFPIIIYPSIAKATTTSSSSSFRPKTLFLPVTKVVHSTNIKQYVIDTKQRTPLVPIKQTLDLGGQYPWLVCDRSYVSSTYKPAHCGSAACRLTKSHVCRDCKGTINTPGCNKNTCIVNTFNRIGHVSVSGELAQDIVSILAVNNSIVTTGKPVSVPKFLFVCGKTSQLKGLASGVKGIVGLGRSNLGLPSQFYSAFSLKKKFAVCLSSSTTSEGVVFFGDGPYYTLAHRDFSQALAYTPLIVHPTNSKSSEYYIGVESIKIGDKAVHLNTSLLSIAKDGSGGTRISTVEPYTVLHSAIYKAVVGEFESALRAFIGDDRFKRVAAVKPFGACYNSSYIGIDRLGPVVPRIQLVLHGQSEPWMIYGANAMVDVGENVLCLGFVDGGEIPLQPSIIIGGHQLEDNFLLFDLAINRLGFSSSLFTRQNTCADFIF
ncbi:hypothetical protein FEM48_Zijuj07G0131700 [Ziziphus jujuba var. spinosa]|uniref:Peptidase A1 domain-containing protein n=1 Tax=Ziziphus jujuba var. spinosa TaxID=714518 RepID=A0A978V4U2_ZIZJJ|nr:hypothetical protein FEM48_Zijuj07G0131700 [Ziziphus jujuba var. spinosa]